MEAGTTPGSAFITGASGALGQEVARAFAAAGWRLALGTTSETGATALRRAHPDALIVRADLTQAMEAERALGDVAAAHGVPDALLNLAGGFSTGGAVGPDVLEGMLRVNLWTAYHATRAALPGMLARGSGFVLGVGAAQAVRGGRGAGAYAASKAALVAYLASVRAEVAEHGVGVAILYPMGTVDTAANRAAMPERDPRSFIALRPLAEAALYLASCPANARVHALEVHPAAL